MKKIITLFFILIIYCITIPYTNSGSKARRIGYARGKARAQKEKFLRLLMSNDQKYIARYKIFLEGCFLVSVDSDSKKRVFLGTLENSLEDNSVFNKLGDYGSKLGDKSIWNDLSNYGDKISDTSPWNRSASNPPYILKQKGDNIEVIGRLTLNPIFVNKISIYRIKEIFGIK